MSVVGYYITCDDAVCEDCAPAGFNEGDYSQWDGFESWEEPIVIFRDTESDTPTNCKECGEVIPHALTREGYAYVEQYMRDDIKDALCETNHRGVAVVHAWLEQYADWGMMNGPLVAMHGALYEAMNDAGYFDEEEQ